MTENSNDVNSISVDHPTLIWMASLICLVIALTGAVMAVLNEQKIAELRKEKDQIQALATEKMVLEEALEGGELDELRRLIGRKEELRDEVNGFQKDKETLREELSSITVDLNRTKKEQEQETALTNELTAERNANRKLRETVEAELEVLNTKKRELEEERRGYEDLTTMQTELIRIKSDIDDLTKRKGEFDALDESIRKVETARTELQRSLRLLANEQITYENQVNLRESIGLAKARVEGLETEKGSLQESISGLENQRNSLTKDVSELKQEKNSLQGGMQTSYENQANLSETIGIAKARIQDLETEKGSLQKTISGLEKQRDSLTTDVSELKLEKNSLQVNIQTSKELRTLGNALEVLQEALNKKEDGLNTREIQLNSDELQFSTRLKKINKFIQDIQALNAEATVQLDESIELQDIDTEKYKVAVSNLVNKFVADFIKNLEEELNKASNLPTAVEDVIESKQIDPNAGGEE